MFLHGPSAVTLKPGGKPEENSLFGFSMTYWNDKLIVGAPSSNLFGEVQSCDISKIKYEITCDAVSVNVKETPYCSRDINLGQHFYLGASIAATKEYLFTCAPLVTKTIKRDDSTVSISNAVGACYYYDTYGNTTIYNGPDKRYLENINDQIYSNIDLFEGGMGWTTLADEKFLIVPKSSEFTDINYSNTPIDMLSFPKSLKSKLKGISMDKERNVGYGLAAGKFFSKDTVYAVSMQNALLNGQIIFLERDTRNDEILKPVMQKYQLLIIENYDVGDNFGYSLAATNLDLDSYSDLLVGAPTSSDDNDDTECGALYIFLGGVKKTYKATLREKRRIIFAEKDRGRFGTAVAAQDIDRDGYTEVIVSAPYEGEGVVYIICGYQVYANLILSGTERMRLSDFADHTQRVTRSGMQPLGFSLHVMPDLNELAIGAPNSEKVLSLKGLQSVEAKMSLYHFGDQNVREEESQFVVKVEIDLDYGINVANYSGSLIVTNEVTGAGRTKMSTSDSSYKIDLSEKPSNFAKNITVTFSDHTLGQYTFKTTLKPDNSKIRESSDFDKSWVILRRVKDNTVQSSLVITYNCKGDCTPILTMTIQWTGPAELYEMGSSKLENVTVTVKNSGHASYGACVRIDVRGARVADKISGSTFQLPKPLQFSASYTFNVKLNMENLLSTDKELFVDGKLYDDCNTANFKSEQLKVPYSMETQKKLVKIKGVKTDLQITDDEILDKKIESFQHNQEYLITNEGSITWDNIKVVIKLKNQTLIEKINNPDDCDISDDGNDYEINCKITVQPHSTKTVLASVNMSKVMIGASFNGEKHSKQLTSQLFLYLDSSDTYALNETLVTEITLKKDRTIGNNAVVIIIVSVILGSLLLAIIAFALYKSNFFKRKEKKKLDVLRDSVRRRSIRLASERKASQKTSSCADGDHVDIEVVEDSPFEDVPIGTNDNVILVESQAQVHHEPTQNEKEQ